MTSYTDGDTGYGTTNSISSWGYGGLGSEYGSAYNANYSGDTGFNSYYEADLPAVLQVRLNLLADNNGTPGEIISNDQVGLNRSFFVEIQVADLRGNAAGVNGLGLNLAWDGLILESIDTPFDPTNIITANFPLLQDGTVDNSSGLINNLSGGSLPAFELGQAIGVNQLERFALLRFQTENSTGTYYFTTTVDSAALADDNPYYSLDVETYQPIVVTPAYSQYNFTYNYGNGDSYTGYVYAVDGTYAAGQTIGGYNETGYPGQYTIDSITPTALDSSYNNRVYVTSYTDGDTGYGTTTNVSRDWQGVNGYGGLGSEGGNAYDVNGNSSDPYFSQYYEADIQNQLFNYTYTYGNGDSYSGYGYALAGTYTAGQVLGGYANETGYTGQYTIDSVSAVTTDSSYNNRVYVTSYTDGDTLYGETTNLYSYGGGSGFGSEYGYAYTAEGYTYDSYFSQYSEADLVIPGLAITDNSGNANDSSIKFTTELSKFRKNFQDSDYVRPNYADTTKYFDITNTGSGVLVVSDIQINVSGVTVNLDLSGDKDLLVNPGSSQRVNLTYDPLVAGENFDFDKNGSSLVLFTNIPDWSQYEVKLSGKSTFNSDINYDGKVNTGDLGSLNQAKTNFNKGIFDATADINGDGLINTLDASALTADIKLKLSV